MGARQRTRLDPAEGAAETLYGAPLAAFVAERKRLAAELEQAGEEAAAEHIASLPKPTASAWVVNRLYRDARADVDALLDAGRRMRGGDLAATGDQRAALARLHQRAGEILLDGGHAASRSMLRRVTMTLQALSAAGSFEPDPPGQLSRDRDPPGFDLLAGVVLSSGDEGDEPVRAKGGARAGKAKAKAEAREPALDPAERRRRERAEAEHKLLERSAVQAARRADARERAVADLRADLERAEATAERLRSALHGAEQSFDEARAAADRARAAADQAARSLADR